MAPEYDYQCSKCDSIITTVRVMGDPWWTYCQCVKDKSMYHRVFHAPSVGAGTSGKTPPRQGKQ